MQKEFSAVLTARGPGGAWTYLTVPFAVEGVFGGKGQVKVAGTMNGFGFRTSLLPKGDGTHILSVSKELMQGAGSAQGERVAVVLRADKAERVVEVPEDVRLALGEDAVAGAAFAGMAYSHRKAYVDWVVGAKREATRAKRVGEMVGMLRAGKRRE